MQHTDKYHDHTASLHTVTIVGLMSSPLFLCVVLSVPLLQPMQAGATHTSSDDKAQVSMLWKAPIVGQSASSITFWYVGMCIVQFSLYNILLAWEFDSVYMCVNMAIFNSNI